MPDDKNQASPTAGRFAARLRMPLVAIAAVNLAATTTLGISGWWVPVTLVACVAAMALHIRVGTPRSASVDIASPVVGR